MSFRSCPAFLVTLLFATVLRVSGTPLLYYTPALTSNGLGQPTSNDFTQAVKNAFGAANVLQVASFDNTASFADASALFVNARNGTDTLSAQERNNLLNFINAGGAVFFVGEHTGWQAWDDSFLSLFGSSATTWGTAVQAAVVTSAGQAAGFPSGQINVSSAGSISGSAGTALYVNALGRPLASAFGPDGNAIAFLDTNAFSSNAGRNFYEGVAGWMFNTASEYDQTKTAATVPDLGAGAALPLALGAILLAGRRPRRRVNPTKAPDSVSPRPAM